MKTIYEIQIACTGKSYSSTDEYRIFDNMTERFDTLDAAKQFIADRYGKCKRIKMYRDNSYGESYQSGWVYCFNADDISHLPIQKWRQQDWVQIVELQQFIVCGW